MSSPLYTQELLHLRVPIRGTSASFSVPATCAGDRDTGEAGGKPQGTAGTSGTALRAGSPYGPSGAGLGWRQGGHLGWKGQEKGGRDSSGGAHLARGRCSPSPTPSTACPAAGPAGRAAGTRLGWYLRGHGQLRGNSPGWDGLQGPRAGSVMGKAPPAPGAVGLRLPQAALGTLNLPRASLGVL